jgi:hypothetical protein
LKRNGRHQGQLAKLSEKSLCRHFVVACTAMSSVESQSIEGRHPDNDAYIKMVESGHIGFQLAEEVRTLREEILSLKQEKRLLLVSNENLEESAAQANAAISLLRAKVEEQQRYVDAFNAESVQQV